MGTALPVDVAPGAHRMRTGCASIPEGAKSSAQRLATRLDHRGMSMITKEILHARPEAHSTVSPCCGRTLAQLPQYDRITFDESQVTCGRLSTAEALLLSGQPVVTDPANEHVLFSMALAVVTLRRGEVSLPDALHGVHVAMREILPTDRATQAWSAALMAEVTCRAEQLVKS